MLFGVAALCKQKGPALRKAKKKGDGEREIAQFWCFSVCAIHYSLSLSLSLSLSRIKIYIYSILYRAQNDCIILTNRLHSTFSTLRKEAKKNKQSNAGDIVKFGGIKLLEFYKTLFDEKFVSKGRRRDLYPFFNQIAYILEDGNFTPMKWPHSHVHPRPELRIPYSIFFLGCDGVNLARPLWFKEQSPFHEIVL